MPKGVEEKRAEIGPVLEGLAKKSCDKHAAAEEVESTGAGDNIAVSYDME